MAICFTVRARHSQRRFVHISFDALLESDEASKGRNGRKRRTNNDERTIPVFPSQVQSDTARKILDFIKTRSLDGKKWMWLLKEHNKTVEPVFIGEVLTHLANEEAALKVFRWASEQNDYFHTLYTYNCLLGTLVRAGAHRAAYSSFIKMLKRGYVPDEYSCSTVLRGFCNAHEPDRAYQALKEMSKAGVKPTINSLNVVLEGFCKDNLLSQATGMLAKIKVNSCPDANTYNILIKAMGAEYWHGEADHYYTEMLRRGIEPTSTTFSILVWVYCKAYRLDDATAMLKEMLDRGHKPSFETYTTLMFAYLNSPRKAQAGYEIFRMLLASGYEVDGACYQAMVDGFWRAGLVDEARSFLKEMAAKGFTPSVLSYTNIIEAVCDPDKVEQAYEAYQELLKVGHFPYAKTCVRLIDVLTAMDRVTEAFQVYEKMVEKYRPNQYTFHAMLWCLCRASKFELAFMLLQEVLFKFRNFVPRTSSYNCLLSHYCCVPVQDIHGQADLNAWQGQSKVLDLDKALELFQRMVRKGRQPNQYTFWMLIYGLCKDRRPYDAYKLFKTMPEFQVLANDVIYELVVKELCKAGLIAEAEDVFDELMTTWGEEKLVKPEREEQKVSKIYSLVLAARARQKAMATARLCGVKDEDKQFKRRKPFVELSQIRAYSSSEELGW